MEPIAGIRAVKSQGFSCMRVCSSICNHPLRGGRSQGDFLPYAASEAHVTPICSAIRWDLRVGSRQRKEWRCPASRKYWVGCVPTKMRTSCMATLGDGWGADRWVGFFHGDWMGALSLKQVQRVEGGKHVWWAVGRLCSSVLWNWAHVARLVLRMGVWRC